MATYIWFVPGFMGSSLGLYPTSGGQRSGPLIASLWGTYRAVANLPRVQLLKLPSTLPPNQGIFPDGLADVAGQGYADFLAWLDANTPAGTTPHPWPFDWRLSCRANGELLANALIASAAGGNTNWVLSHSQGALVAWCAWASLVDRQQTAAMPRWVTFGGALYGTSSTPQFFLEDEDSVAILARLQFWIAEVTGAAFYLAPAGRVPVAGMLSGRGSEEQVGQLLDMAASWPGIYDLYPDAALLDDPGDTNRGLLYDPNKWVAALALPNFTLLQQSVASVMTPIRQAQYLPPPSVVSHIVGMGTSTAYRVQPASFAAGIPVQGFGQFVPNPNSTLGRKLRLPSFSVTTDGDGRCTPDQQRFPNRYWQRVGSAHASMQNDPAVRALILNMFSNPNPVRPTLNPVSVTVAEPWVPPTADTGLPQFIFNDGPVNITPAPQVYPIRVGADP